MSISLGHGLALVLLIRLLLFPGVNTPILLVFLTDHQSDSQIRIHRS